MKNLWLAVVLLATGCNKAGPEGAFLSNAIPLEVKKDGEKYAITIAEDIQFLGTLEKRVLSAKHNGKDYTLEFDEQWAKATLKDGVLAREFTRVPPEDLPARIDAAKAELKAEKKKLKEEQAKNEKRLKEAEALLAKGKKDEARAALQALATEAPDYEAKKVQDRLAELAPDAG
jgi:hypothetical protein